MDIKRLMDVIDRLRGPGGCPWDRGQTLETLRPYLTDEAHEVFSAINSLDRDNLTEELGDLLFHVLMLCRAAEMEEGITFSGICRSIEEKMIRRHPHVFGDVKVNGIEDVLKNWEEIKAAEKSDSGSDSIYSDSLKYLPALRRAQRIQEKARQVGFDWEEVSGVLEKIREELEEVVGEIGNGDRRRQKEELGDLLFAVVNLIRFLDFDAELTLQKMINRWIQRFRAMEDALKEQGRCIKDTSSSDLDALWEEIGEGRSQK